MRLNATARIQRRIYKKPNGCHGWYGCTDSSGYPTAMIDGKNAKIHRWLFARAHPEVDIDKKWVATTCLDKGCLNVDHMKPSPMPRGWRGKHINWDLVRRIRRMPPGANMAAVARDVGIAPSTARLIRKNLTWRE
jgi:hypothetical protein